MPAYLSTACCSQAAALRKVCQKRKKMHPFFRTWHLNTQNDQKWVPTLLKLAYVALVKSSFIVRTESALLIRHPLAWEFEVCLSLFEAYQMWSFLGRGDLCYGIFSNNEIVFCQLVHSQRTSRGLCLLNFVTVGRKTTCPGQFAPFPRGCRQFLRFTFFSCP